MAEVGNPIKLVVGGLSNRHHPMRLGVVSAETMAIEKLVRAENVDITDNKVGLLREGRTKVYDGVPHSLWVDPRNDQEGYFVEVAVLKQLDVLDLAAPLTVTTLDSNNPLVYEPVNDDTVVTNGVNLGWLKAGVYAEFAPTLVPFTATTAAGSNVLTSVAGVTPGQTHVGVEISGPNIPLGTTIIGYLGTSFYLSDVATTSESLLQFAPSDYCEKMPAGQFLAFLNGVLYVAAGAVLVASLPYNVEVYDKRHGVLPMPGGLRMLGAVEDGLWLSTPYGVVFLRGGGTEDFVYVPRTKPAYYGAFYAGYDFKGRRVCAWASEDGIQLGLASGQIERVTPDDVAFPAATQGRLFKTTRNGINQWIAVVHNPGPGNAYVPPEVAVNTQYL